VKKLIALVILFLLSSFASVICADQLGLPDASIWLEKLKNGSTKKPVEKVSVQLKWLHQFQFAGYYAAQELGYYRDAGFEVTLIEGRPDQNLIDNVLQGKSEFGVGTSDLLLRRTKQPVVVLAVIFQHSPITLMYKKGEKIGNIHDIIGKKVALDFAFEGEIDGFFRNEKIDPNSYTKTTLTDNVDALIKGDIDVMAVYSFDEPFYLQEKKIPYGLFSPREGGIDFYGDNLFTTESYVKKHPEQTKAFTEATIKGWLYAMDHPDEIIELILTKYSQRYSREHLFFQYQQMLPLIQPKLVEMGYMHEGRWRHIANTYAEQGMLPPSFSLKGFIYEKNPRPNLTIFYSSLAVLSSGLLLFWGLSVQRARLNKRLRTEITQEIEKNQQQKQRFIEQLEQTNKLLEEQVKIRTAWLNNALEKLQTLLNNSGEGFLAFDAMMLIDEGYSEECTHLFAEKIAGKQIDFLLFSDQPKQQINFQKNIQRILRETDIFKQNLLLSLLPKQFVIGQKIIAASYKPLSNNTMMMKMVDITEAEALKKQLIDERKQLLFIVEVVSEPKDFFDLKREYLAFINHDYLAIIQQAGSLDNKMDRLYRKIHTFKGVFLQKALLYTPMVLHQLEMDLSALKTAEDCSELILMQQFIKHDLAGYFQQDLDYLQSVLGEHYFAKKGHIQISEQALKDSISYARQLINELPFSHDNMLGLVRKMQQLRFVDIKSLLASYPKIVQQLADRLEKNIAEFSIEGDSVFVDPDYFNGFSKALIHVFRNCADHGIEAPEQREQADKPEQGSIRCHISQQQQTIIITIKDDGAGINSAQLKKCCIESGRYTQQQLDNFSEQQVLQLIFEQNLSTASRISLISGQGVGLAAVYEELKKINGSVLVDSHLGQGTCFTFILPIHDLLLDDHD
jgi:ABC-type nitrate/sulfonate/bicarbonate transport system substrate-binding protein/signal transduction histidine kinase